MLSGALLFTPALPTSAIYNVGNSYQLFLTLILHRVPIPVDTALNIVVPIKSGRKFNDLSHSIIKFLKVEYKIIIFL